MYKKENDKRKGNKRVNNVNNVLFVLIHDFEEFQKVIQSPKKLSYIINLYYFY